MNWEKIREHISSNSNIFVADNTTKNTEKPNLEISMCSIPIVPYYEVNFIKTEEIVVIIGGETEGISQECYQFALERNGVRLNVPLSNDVDSLNTNTAFGVVAFEIKRQMLS